MAKRQATGYLVLSPASKKTLKGGLVKFGVKIQEGEGKQSITDVVGFGEKSYHQVRAFSESKSPVKIQLFPPGDGFKNEVISQRSEIRSASAVDVPFDYALSVEDTSAVSSVQSIGELLDFSTFSETKLYDVQGKVHVGTKKTKFIQMVGKKVKEDVTLFDVNNKIAVSVFEPLYESLNTGEMISLSSVKTREYKGKITLTTTPSTTISLLPDNPAINIPDEFDEENHNLGTLEVEEIDSVANFSRFYKCNHCDHKVLDAMIRKGSYDCSTCGNTYRKKHLIETFMVPMRIGDMNFTAPSETIKKVLGEVTNETEIRDELLNLENIKIVYNTDNNMIKSIVTL